MLVLTNTCKVVSLNLVLFFFKQNFPLEGLGQICTKSHFYTKGHVWTKVKLKINTKLLTKDKDYWVTVIVKTKVK